MTDEEIFDELWPRVRASEDVVDTEDRGDAFVLGRRYGQRREPPPLPHANAAELGRPARVDEKTPH